LRVQKILANERSDARQIQQKLEAEIKKLESRMLEVRLENENLLVQVSELNQTNQQISFSR